MRKFKKYEILKTSIFSVLIPRTQIAVPIIQINYIIFVQICTINKYKKILKSMECLRKGAGVGFPNF